MKVQEKIKKNYSLTKIKLLILLLIFLVLGIVLGIFFDKFFLNKREISTDFHSVRISDPNYKLISPLLLAGISVQGDTQEFKEIESKLKSQTNNLLKIPGMQDISLYFKDLNSGLWAGIGQDTGYDPASLLKVPIMIAWFKKEQNYPGTLSQRLVWTGSPYDDKGLDFYSLHPGQSYTVDELINLMITKSDNDAKDLLLTNLDSQTLNIVFTDLGIKEWGDTSSSSTKISPAMYSRFLRVLYNATYLNHDLSEKALELLSSTDFNSGIVAGISSNIKIAHKFGQYTTSDPTSPIELHDCGIVYIPQKPYLLCVMTKGATDIVNLEAVIKNISLTVFNEVSKNS